MNKPKYTAFAVLAFGSVFSAAAAEYFAAPGVTDDASKTCLSAETAGTITNAMARATADGDIVTLASGTYDMSEFTPVGGLFFNVAKRITVRSRAEDPAGVTIKGGGTAQPSRCFSFKDSSSLVRGITFTGFYSGTTSAGTVKGGTLENCIFTGNAICGTAGTCVNGSVCRDCTFTDNVYTNSGTHYYGGGAGSGGSYYGCRFERNRAYDSSRGHQANGGALWKPSVVSNCVFIGNYASRRGGAVGSDSGTYFSCLVVDSFFTNNTASVGGGAVYGVTVSNCVVSGSAVECSEGAAANNVKAYNTLFADNICTNRSHYYGGGAAAWGSYYNCRFERNKLTNPGGHQSFGGAILQPAYVSNCVFTANTNSYRGGAIGRNGSSEKYTSVIVDSRFIGNSANSGGGAVVGATVTNCVFSGNIATGSGSAAQYVKAHGCTFEDNISTLSSHYCGGAGHYGEYTSCVFRRNTTVSEKHEAYGGALLFPSIVSNCVFTGNLCSCYGGAVYGDSGMLILDSFFTNNVAKWRGGAVFAGTVSNCTFVGSVLTEGQYGSAAHNVHATDSRFIGNVMTNVYSATSGGAHSGGSALNCVYIGNMEYSANWYACASACFNVAMTNCLVTRNICRNDAGALYGGSAVWAPNKPCVNCTIVSNECYATSTIGAAAGKFVNCIIIGNHPFDVYNHSNAGTSALTNCIYGTLGSSGAVTSVDTVAVASIDRLKFKSLDPSSSDAFHITRRSPARNAGFDAGFGSGDLDLAGNPRVLEGVVDIGCFECSDPRPGMTVIVR